MKLLQQPDYCRGMQTAHADSTCDGSGTHNGSDRSGESTRSNDGSGGLTGTDDWSGSP